MAQDLADRLAIDLRNAYEAHDSILFGEHLERMKRLLRYAGPPPPPAPPSGHALPDLTGPLP